MKMQNTHTSRISTFQRVMAIVVCTTVMLVSLKTADARIRLENICQVAGQKEVRLVGTGLVIGLDGTGDGGDNGPTVRALAAAMKAMDSPVLDPKELVNADNVAMVQIQATIPRGGLQKGQKIDCYVSSILGAKSLRGGRLFVSALQTADLRDKRLMGTASGAVIIEDQVVLTKGRIPNGVMLEIDMVKGKDFADRIVMNDDGVSKIRLLLDEAHASFGTSSTVSRSINDDLSFGLDDQKVAKAISPGVIDVVIPKFYKDDPIAFVSRVLQVWVDTPNTQAKVIVNPRTKMVIVTAEVEISPTLITHPNLEVSIRPGDLRSEIGSKFADLSENQGGQTTARLDQLVTALKQLRVPPEGIIEVLRELSKSGKMHAIYEER